MLRKVLFYFAILVLILYTVFPFYWAMNGSLQPPERIFETPAHYLPIPASTESYEQAFENQTFTRALHNSIAVAGVTSLLSLVLAFFAAIALARFRMRGRGAILAIVLGMTIFPQISILGAVHTVITKLGLFNTLAGLTLSYMLLTLPLSVWILSNFMKSLPRELEESAAVDGASLWSTIWRVLLPLSLPAIATTGLLAFIASWNEYIFALSFTVTEESRTVPVAIANFAGATMHQSPWGAIMAASVVITVPMVVMVLIFQRGIIEGLTAGALKD